MALKKVVQDIVPSPRRSIRSIPISRTKSEKREDEIVKEEIKPQIRIAKEPRKKFERSLTEDRLGSDGGSDEENISVPTKIKKVGKKKGKFSKILIFLVILLCITIISIALSLLYSKAIVAVMPEKLDLNVNGNFIAKKDANIDDSLAYQIVTISSEANKPIVAVDGPLVQTKAKGTIVLFNSFSSTTQKIVAGTRLTKDNGLIYKTLTTVSVPGKKMVQGKTVIGSVSVGVIADKAGAEYNMKFADLTSNMKLPGYKGTDKYDGFYGKLKTEITGGFSGTKKTISPEAEKAAVEELNKAIETKLLASIANSIPNGYIMFNKAYTIDYQRISSTTNTLNSANIGVKGTLYSVIFNSKTLVDYIARKQISDSRLVDYKVDGLKDLTFKIINSKDFSPKKENTLSFSLAGPIRITGLIAEEDLKKKLLGLKVKEIDSVIKNNPSVKYATVLLTPFWMRSFPTSPENITIEYK